jgi:CRP/FNR family transcriptional regulator, cyclic AMP receptor protein
MDLHSPHARSIRLFLKGNTFLGKLPDVALDALIECGQLRKFSKRDSVYRRGEPGDSLMVVVAGRVKLTNINAVGKEHVLYYLVPGNIYGEIAALDGKERAANAVALEDSEIFLIYTRDLMPTLKAHPDAMLEVIKALCAKVRAGAEMIEDSTLEMRARVARGLLRLARQHGQRSADGICVQLALTQAELGSYLNLSRANVSRELGDLKVANVIRIDGPQIVITDEQGLTDIADAAAAKD